jgi:two-component system NtrC family response regulator
MLGTDPKVLEVFSSVRKVATTDVPVLITGESGTGKELVARAIHHMSGRKGNPFVVINCAAIPENLLESELFGHEKGAFTGAHAQRKGRFEMAQGGTLFLDEIGELPPSLQIKLLRFLQEQQIERVGGREQIVVDARIVAATNRDLKQGIGEGRFREDLYYRLSVVTVFLPALRDRGEDVLLLANAFLKRFSMEKGGKSLKFSERAVNALRKHYWPGNIRELENRVKRAIIMTESDRITPVDLELTPAGGQEGHQSLKEAREALEKNLILKALSRNRGNISKAAAELDISRPTLYDLMNKLGISTPGV